MKDGTSLRACGVSRESARVVASADEGRDPSFLFEMVGMVKVWRTYAKSYIFLRE